MGEHRRPDADPDDTDAGYRDSLEERAYQEAAAEGWNDPDADEDEDQREDAAPHPSR